MTLSDLWPRFQSHDITQHQITKKTVKLYLQLRTNRKSNGAIFNDLEQPLTQFSRSRYYFNAEYLKTTKDTAIVTMEGE